MYIRKASSDNHDDRINRINLEAINSSLKSDLKKLGSQVSQERKRNKSIIILIGVLVLVTQVIAIIMKLVYPDS